VFKFVPPAEQVVRVTWVTAQVGRLRSKLSLLLSPLHPSSVTPTHYLITTGVYLSVCWTPHQLFPTALRACACSEQQLPMVLGHWWALLSGNWNLTSASSWS
jgi:hypothetical protein